MSRQLGFFKKLDVFFIEQFAVSSFIIKAGVRQNVGNHCMHYLNSRKEKSYREGISLLQSFLNAFLQEGKKF